MREGGDRFWIDSRKSGWRLEHDRKMVDGIFGDDWKMVDGIFGDDWRWIGDQGKVFLVKVNFFFPQNFTFFRQNGLKMTFVARKWRSLLEFIFFFPQNSTFFRHNCLKITFWMDFTIFY